MIRPLAVDLLSLDLIISWRPFIRGCNLTFVNLLGLKADIKPNLR